MKKFFVILLAFAGISLTACGSNSPASSPDGSESNQNGDLSVHHVPVDGRTVTCLEALYALSCDWNNNPQ